MRSTEVLWSPSYRFFEIKARLLAICRNGTFTDVSWKSAARTDMTPLNVNRDLYCSKLWVKGFPTILSNFPWHTHLMLQYRNIMLDNRWALWCRIYKNGAKDNWNNFPASQRPNPFSILFSIQWVSIEYKVQPMNCNLKIYLIWLGSPRLFQVLVNRISNCNSSHTPKWNRTITCRWLC